ncbi:uncharacterized protein LOC123681474 [Harmonia axyridis]|uniref:uncharacterized protein LOC123681474 n=1 Tax=Harmonia axyridis TaxID=115357 RepID=UPI001E277E40|nr:uncharacterized protein LOC123681474 [Harmonia axyridis]
MMADCIGMTAKEVQLLRKSHEELSQDPAAMRKVFLEYFRQYPHNQKFFSFRNVFLEELPENTDFKIQCALVTAYMSACIENLEDYDVVEGILTNLGKNHKKYKIPTEAFWQSRNVIVQGLSELVDEETHLAHSKYWDFVVHTVLKGLER